VAHSDFDRFHSPDTMVFINYLPKNQSTTIPSLDPHMKVIAIKHTIAILTGFMPEKCVVAAIRLIDSHYRHRRVRSAELPIDGPETNSEIQYQITSEVA